MSSKMEKGTIQHVEVRQTDQGDTYYRIQIGDIWGSFWGPGDQLEKGDEVEFEKKIKKTDQGTFTNWKELSKVPEEEQKTTKREPNKKIPEEEKEELSVIDYKIMRQSALKSATRYCQARLENGDQAIDTNTIISAAEVFYEWLNKEI